MKYDNSVAVKNMPKKVINKGYIVVFILFSIYLLYSNLAIPYNLNTSLLRPFTFLILTSILVSLLVNFLEYRITIFTTIIASIILFIQVIVFDISLSSKGVNTIILWPFLTFIVEYLIKKNPDTLLYLALLVFGLVLILWSKRIVVNELSYARVYFEGTAFDNSNSMAQWLGFSTLTFFGFGKKKRAWLVKYLLWALSFFSLLYMAQSISRGALLALAISLIMSLKNLSKKDLLLLLLFLVLAFLFATDQQNIVDIYYAYLARGLTDTGRESVWRVGLSYFLENPVFGYGIEKVQLYNSSLGGYLSPHNDFLQIGLMGGVLPLILVIILWIKTLAHSLRLYFGFSNEYIETLPFITYAFINLMLTNDVIYSPWCISILCMATYASQKK